MLRTVPVFTPYGVLFRLVSENPRWTLAPVPSIADNKQLNAKGKLCIEDWYRSGD